MLIPWGLNPQLQQYITVQLALTECFSVHTLQRHKAVFDIFLQIP